MHRSYTQRTHKKLILGTKTEIDGGFLTHTFKNGVGKPVLGSHVFGIKVTTTVSKIQPEYN